MYFSKEDKMWLNTPQKVEASFSSLLMLAGGRVYFSIIISCRLVTACVQWNWRKVC